MAPQGWERASTDHTQAIRRRQETDEHRASGHVQYRSWCESCVMARGLMDQHHKPRHKPAVCVFIFDYLFLDERAGIGDATLADADVENEWRTVRGSWWT